MRTTILLGVILFLPLCGRAQSTRPAAGEDKAPLPGYQLVWADEFEGGKLDEAKWQYRTDSRYWSVQKAANVSVADGKLRLALKKEPAGDKQYTGAGVISRRSFRYGYYEASFRVPPGAGWHTSFWMMWHSARGAAEAGAPAPSASAPTPTSAPAPTRAQELDVCENDSVDTKSYSVNTHRWGSPHQALGHKRIKTPDLSAGFHTFGCEFTPQAVHYFFDGKLVQTVDATKFEHGDQHIWLTSIAAPLGGTKSVDDARLPTVAEFEYVRFYEKK